MSGAQWGLKAFCIACAKFQEGDALGEVLAVAAAAPYFAVYHAAVLLHARRCGVGRVVAAAGVQWPPQLQTACS